MVSSALFQLDADEAEPTFDEKEGQDEYTEMHMPVWPSPWDTIFFPQWPQEHANHNTSQWGAVWANTVQPSWSKPLLLHPHLTRGPGALIKRRLHLHRTLSSSSIDEVWTRFPHDLRVMGQQYDTMISYWASYLTNSTLWHWGWRPTEDTNQFRISHSSKKCLHYIQHICHFEHFRGGDTLTVVLCKRYVQSSIQWQYMISRFQPWKVALIHIEYVEDYMGYIPGVNIFNILSFYYSCFLLFILARQAPYEGIDSCTEKSSWPCVNVTAI